MFRDLAMVAGLLLAMGGTMFGVVWKVYHRHPTDPGSSLPVIPVVAAIADTAPDTQPATQPVTAAAEETPTAPHFNSIELWAKDAKSHGSLELAERTNIKWKGRGGRWGDAPHEAEHHLSGFRTANDYAEWPIEVSQPGEYEFSASFACPQWMKSRFVVQVAGSELLCSSHGIGNEMTFRVISIGKLTLPAGKTTLILRGAPMSGEAVFMNMRKIELIPTATASF